MRSRIILLTFTAVVVVGTAAPALAATSRWHCTHTRAQARREVRAAERQGKRAIKALLKVRCRGARAATDTAPVPDPLLAAELTAATTNSTVNNELWSSSNVTVTEGGTLTYDDTPEVADPTVDDPTNPAMPLYAGGAPFSGSYVCHWHGNVVWPARVWLVGVHVATITKTIDYGWCSDGTTILFIRGWGHRVPWVNPNTKSVCWLPGYRVGHSAIPPWLWDQGGWHTRWAHGFIIDTLATAADHGLCTVPVHGNYWAIIRPNAASYWDHVNDYGFQH